MITDYNGDEYQRIEYTPYGETWVEKTQNTGLEYLPYKFTGKEMDEETGLYYYGARYLDPKYSRWISVDPALGEYIPAAGKGNSENAGNLPGMGGIYNHINGDLYHYAGNNPVRYTDPDGKILNSVFELQFVKEVLGNDGLFAYLSAFRIKLSGKDRSGSFPISIGLILYSEDIYNDPMNSGDKGRNTFIHEIFHQMQYDTDITAFPHLIKEYFLNEDIEKNGLFLGYDYVESNNFVGFSINKVYDGNPVINYVYGYDIKNLSKYNTLSDLPFYEAQAQLVGDFAELYYTARYGGGFDIYTAPEKSTIIKEQARIMQKSNYNTEAVQWVLENF